MEAIFRGKFWRTPFYPDSHPTYKESTGTAWVGRRECDSAWYIYNMDGFPQASLASRGYQFGLDIIKTPNADFSRPPLDPNMGSNGQCKFFCVNGYQHEAAVLLRKRKLNTLGANAKKKAKPGHPRRRLFLNLLALYQVLLQGPPGYGVPLAFQPQAVPPPPAPMVRERHGWLMKTKELIVAYKLRYWHVFDTLAQKHFAVHLDHSFCLILFYSYSFCK